MDALRGFLENFGTLQSLQLSCSPRHPGNLALIVRMRSGNLEEIVRQLGGTRFGDTIVAFRPIPDGFHCPKWQDGPLEKDCYDCLYRNPNSGFPSL